MEENCSEDIGVDVVRIFDVNPREQWPLPSSNIVLGGIPLNRMPYVEDDRQRPYIKDGQVPITWFIVYGSVRDQKNMVGIRDSTTLTGDGFDRRRDPMVSMPGGRRPSRLQTGLYGGARCVRKAGGVQRQIWTELQDGTRQDVAAPRAEIRQD